MTSLLPVFLDMAHLLSLRPLPFFLPALHLHFRDSERLADGVVEAFGVGLAGDRRGWEWFHGVIIAQLVERKIHGRYRSTGHSFPLI